MLPPTTPLQWILVPLTTSAPTYRRTDPRTTMWTSLWGPPSPSSLIRMSKPVNINKLFEVHCNSVDPSLNPVNGRISYDARQQRAEFIPHNTLYPNSQYTVILLGRAVTTTQCIHGTNIKNAELHFHTCSPAPKHIGIKLKGQKDEPETIQIADYYDLYNSLIVWSTWKWGCSGEHITGLYTENEDGKLHALKADHDVLNLRENEVVVMEIKD